MTWAVLTGDIVDSSDMAPEDLDALMSALNDIAKQLSGWQHTSENKTESAFARRGGDGWQIALNRPQFALRAALFVQSCLRSIDGGLATRVATATGDGTVPEQADLNSAHGPVFRDSGRLLDTLKGRTLLAHADGGALGASFRLADHISQGWTQAQARAVHAMLPPEAGPRRLAAERLGISRQAIDQALWAAGFPALNAALQQIEIAQ